MKSVAEKLGIKNSSKVFVWNAPENYINLIEAENINFLLYDDPLPGVMDIIHLFCYNLHDLEISILEHRKFIKQDGAIWVSWPKKSSGFKTDLNDGTIRSFPLSLGLVDIKVCSISALWSGLKFVIRKTKRK